jgi:REP element-mobilizing transposase RayT
MAPPKPIYDPSNCTPAYQLNWVLSVFWRVDPSGADWLGELKRVSEPDGVRVLEHRFAKPKVSQLLLSTKPEVRPVDFVRTVKGRLQHLVRDRFPRAFQRNYAFRSVGSVKREVVEAYVRSQVEHHRMADPRLVESLRPYQICRPEVDLSRPRSTTHGIYWYNLHVVLVVDPDQWRLTEAQLVAVREMISGCSAKHGLSLSRAGIVPDHVHVTVGCDAKQAPSEVALCLLNNLAYACGMRPVFRFGYYVGTFGEYDLGVTWAEQAEGGPL